jgi:hypothetical protein
MAAVFVSIIEAKPHPHAASASATDAEQLTHRLTQLDWPLKADSEGIIPHF